MRRLESASAAAAGAADPSAEQLAAVDDLAALLAKCEGFPLYISAAVRADAVTAAALLLWEFCVPLLRRMDLMDAAQPAAAAAKAAVGSARGRSR